MEGTMSQVLEAIFHRRAIRAFEAVEISPEVRQQILEAARAAPSSFNMQPYRFYWVQSPERRRAVARLCMSQKPAETASALVAAVADIGSLRSTQEAQLDWMRRTGSSEAELLAYNKKIKIARWMFAPGWLGLLNLLKWAILKAMHLWRIIGMPPVSRRGWFQWSTKSTSLACENLMIAVEAVGLNTCPMEGFDNRRLARFLGLSPRSQEIVMVIAIGRKSPAYSERPQWRRPLEDTVRVL